MIAIISGDDGANVNFAPVEKHPGFPREVLGLNTFGYRWFRKPLDSVPFSRAAVPAVEWRGVLLIPNGEVRPRVRTNEVWALQW
jgi:hypothetical protein